MSDEWYASSTEEGSDWYAPGETKTARPDPDPPADKAHRGRGFWVATISLIVIVGLIIGSSALFSKGGNDAPAVVKPGTLPEHNREKDNDEQSPDLFDNFRDYFENYYDELDTPEDCTIPTVTNFPGISVTLRPQDGEALSLNEIYRRCAPSVVAVTAYIAEDNDDRYYWGTGVILTEDGYIITNAHVISGSCRGKVTLWNDEEYEVKLVGLDARSDIAVLKIDARGLTPAEFSDTDSIAVGDQVVAIGNPLGAEFRSTMTEGIISGIDRDISYNGTSLTLLQVSAPINEGNSGGPLFNMYGQVIGITNMKMSSGAGSVSIEGVGFAIPARTVKTMADSILKNGEVLGRPALGLTLGSIPQTAKNTYNLPDGLYVTAVSEGSDCKEQGIRAGDVITAVNGKAVSTTADITDVISTLGVGDTMVLTVWSEENGSISTRDVTVKLVDVNDVY